LILTHLLIAGMAIGVAAFLYSIRQRKSARPGAVREPSVSRMMAGPVNQVRAVGVLTKIMPLHIRSSDDQGESSDERTRR